MIDEKTQLNNSSGNHAGNGLVRNNLSATSGALPVGIREGNAGLLSLKDIEAQIGDGTEGFYGRLRRFADAPGIGEWVGAVNVSGAKGVRYEPRSAEIFRRLLDASTAGEVSPKIAVAWLKTHSLKTHSEDTPPSPETAIAEKTQTGNSAELTPRGLAAVFTPVVSIMQEVRDLLHDFRSGKAQIGPPPPPLPDRLLNAEEAAYLLGCKPGTVSSRVRPVLRGRYRQSDVYNFIASLEPKTETSKDLEPK